MKRISFLSVLTVAGFFAALTSCKKDEQKEPLSAGTASVSGRLTANLDETDFQTQAVPAGTGISFIIDGADLERNPQMGYNYEDVIVNGSVGTDGMYSVSLPAVKNSITATVVFDDFEFDATVITTDDNGFQQVVTERRTFSRANASVSIIDGQVVVQDYNYSTGVGTYVPSAIIRGVVEAQFADNVGEPNNINQNAVGSGYPASSNETDVNVTGGTGTGMTVNYFTNAAGEVTNVFINTSGDGYTIGDIITIADGDDNATFEITNVITSDESVPEGVVLTFTVGGEPYKVVTDPSGEYFARVPANQGAASITGIDFETASVYFENGSFVTGPKIYSFDNVANQALTEGAIIELDLSYSRSN